MSETAARTRTGLSRGAKRGILIAIIVIALAFVVLGTRVVSDDAEQPAAAGGFDAETYGADNFATVQQGIIDRAADGPALVDAIASDKDAAVAEFAVDSSGGPVFSVTLTGTFGDGESGIYDIELDGVSDGPQVRVQTGPAINGTELRDATGEISFGEFTNQIDYQNAAAALNAEMKAQVLDGIDTDQLAGKTATVTGAFTLVNPDAWLITPVQLEVE